MKDKKYVTLQEMIEGMSEEELERFKKERYEKCIKPKSNNILEKR